MLLGPDGQPFEVKSNVYSLDQLGNLAEFARSGTASGVNVNAASALQMTAVFCAIRVISEDIAGMPVRIVRPTRVGPHTAHEFVDDHWAVPLLTRKPNAFQTPFQFKEYAITACLLDKGFLGIKNVVRGEVREILPLPMGSWSIRRDPGEWEHHFEVSYDAATVGKYRPKDVVFMRGPSLNGWEALPILETVRESIGLAQSLERQQARLAGNGGKPSGVLSFEESLSPEMVEKIRDQWQEKYGPNGDGGIAVFDRSAKFSSMTMTSVDAQTMEARGFQIEEIARAFRVHSNKLMHSGNQATYASAREFNQAHVQDALMPWMRRFEESIDRDLLEGTDFHCDLDESAHLRGNMQETGEYITKMLGSGGHQQVLTVNEARAQIGKDPIKEAWADEIPEAVQPETAPIEAEADENDPKPDDEKAFLEGLLEGLMQ